MRMTLSAALLLGGVSACGASVPAGGLVVVELFQSQGCSSCPPADVILNGLADRPDVIALNFSVTYWDYLGWKDSFAQSAFTERQRDYAANGRGQVATPQMVLNGRAAVVGNRKAEVDAAIAQIGGIAGGPAIGVAGNVVEIGSGSAATPATLWLVRYDPRAIAVPIRGGENGGRTIVHKNIVRQLVPLGSWRGRPLRFSLPQAGAGLRSAVFLQAGRGGAIVAARRI